MCQHIVVEAETLDAACAMAVSDDIAWDTQEMDSDNARKTAVTNVKVIPDSLELVAGDIILRRDRPSIPVSEFPGTASADFFTRMRPRPARCSRSLPSSPTTNNPPRPLSRR